MWYQVPGTVPGTVLNNEGGSVMHHHVSCAGYRGILYVVA